MVLLKISLWVFLLGPGPGSWPSCGWRAKHNYGGSCRQNRQNRDIEKYANRTHMPIKCVHRFFFEIGECAAIVGRAEADFFQNLGNRVLDGFRLQNIADFDEMAGEGERAQG